MKNFADFCNHNNLYELKPSWVIRKPPWFTDMDMARWRFDPIITPLVVGTMVAGTVMEMKGTLEEGKQAEKIAEQRAAIDIKSAEAARAASVEEAKIRKEQGRRLIERQKGIVAASGIRLGVGAPLVIEAQTKADIARDIGFILERGREEAGFYRSRAGIERATGKAARRRSKWEAISQGLTGFGSLAMMGTEAGWFKKKKASPWARSMAAATNPWLD